MVPLIALYTDFGIRGPYVGQMQAVFALQAPGVPFVTLLSDAPAFAPRPAAYLLAALAGEMPDGSLIVAVVDPGVGSDRKGLVVRTDRHWFIGPDNGLLAIVGQQAKTVDYGSIEWVPEGLSASFHGRDWFAPVAARIARGESVQTSALPDDRVVGWDWPADLAEVIYIDEYGNGFTGLRAAGIDRRARVVLAGQAIAFARTFSDAVPGRPFWYENSIGLVEIAVNGDSAARFLGLEVGVPVRLELTEKDGNFLEPP